MANKFTKYILVGLVNTAITITFILILTYIGCNIYIANMTGYVIGIAASFILNSKLTFQSKMSTEKLIKFLIVCLLSYFVNLFAINYLLFSLSFNNAYLAQLIGCIFYTTIGYLLNKYWIFK
jgi:putative flippase GtrA